jgi:hypothetical protein
VLLTSIFVQSQMFKILQARQDSDTKEREISREIAQKYPLKSSAFTCHPPSTMEEISIDTCKSYNGETKTSICARRGKALPSPLTSDVIAAALAELPPGASAALKTCVRCWHDGRLGADEVVGTARSFAGSSPTLSRALSRPAEPPCASCGEVATAEQMDELARLAQSKRPRPTA